MVLAGFWKSMTAAYFFSVLPPGIFAVTEMPSRIRKYFSSLIFSRDAVDRRCSMSRWASSSWAGVSHGFKRSRASRKYRGNRISCSSCGPECQHRLTAWCCRHRRPPSPTRHETGRRRSLESGHFRSRRGSWQFTSN